MLIWRFNLRNRTLRREPIPDAWERLGGRGLVALIIENEVLGAGTTREDWWSLHLSKEGARLEPCGNLAGLGVGDAAARLLECYRACDCSVPCQCHLRLASRPGLPAGLGTLMACSGGNAGEPEHFPEAKSNGRCSSFLGCDSSFSYIEADKRREGWPIFLLFDAAQIRWLS